MQDTCLEPWWGGSMRSRIFLEKHFFKVCWIHIYHVPSTYLWHLWVVSTLQLIRVLNTCCQDPASKIVVHACEVKRTMRTCRRSVSQWIGLTCSGSGNVEVDLLGSIFHGATMKFIGKINMNLPITKIWYRIFYCSNFATLILSHRHLFHLLG